MLRLNKRYTFSVYPIAILGTGFKNAKLIGITSFQEALKVMDVVNLSKQVKPYLPPSTTVLPGEDTYYIFELTSGDKAVVAESWFDITKVREENGGSTFTIRYDNMSAEDKQVVIDQAKILGLQFTVQEV